MTQKPLTNGEVVFTVSARERWLIEELRKAPFSRVEVITMAGGQPDRIEKIRESVKYVAP